MYIYMYIVYICIVRPRRVHVVLSVNKSDMVSETIFVSGNLVPFTIMSTKPYEDLCIKSRHLGLG